jgi:hypothetical protein
LILGLECEATIFRSNHASNTLTLAGVLPKDKQALLGILDETLAHPNSARFVPRWRRGL